MVKVRATLEAAVRDARADLGLTQHELADKAKVGRGIVARIETGRLAEVTPRIARKLGKALGVELRQWEKK